HQLAGGVVIERTGLSQTGGFEFFGIGDVGGKEDVIRGAVADLCKEIAGRAVRNRDRVAGLLLEPRADILECERQIGRRGDGDLASVRGDRGRYHKREQSDRENSATAEASRAHLIAISPVGACQSSI